MDITLDEKMKIREIEDYLKYKSLDSNDQEFLTKLIPYYTDLLNKDFEENKLHYLLEVFGLKNWGYKVTRNSQGLHKLQYIGFAD